jgi:hypothetical protein
MCPHFNLEFIQLNKLKEDGCFDFISKYFVFEGYKAGMSFYFIPKVSYLMIKTKLYLWFQNKPQYIAGITDLNSFDIWIIKQDIFR